MDEQLKEMTIQRDHWLQIAREKDAQIDRLDSSMREIAAGKTKEDWSDTILASRLCSIAREAIRASNSASDTNG